MRIALFFLCTIIVGCVTGQVATTVKVMKFEEYNTTELFIVSPDTTLTIGYIVKIDPKKDALANNNYEIILHDGYIICDIDGARRTSYCFAFPEENTEIMVSAHGNVLLRHEVSPGCYTIYKPKHVADLHIEQNRIRGQIYSGLLRKPYLITTEGCSKKPTTKI